MSIRRKLAFAFLTLAVHHWSGASSWAGFVSQTGDISIINAPASLELGALKSDTAIQAFTEGQRITLGSSVAVNAASPGTVSIFGDLSPGTIQAGTMVDSYFFHTQPVSASATYDGSMTFGTKILGVIVLQAQLDATDAQFAAPGTLYPTGTIGRELELNPIADMFTISGDQTTLTLHLTTGSVLDQIRVLTAPSVVPEPISASLMSLGGACSLGLVRLRRRRASA